MDNNSSEEQIFKAGLGIGFNKVGICQPDLTTARAYYSEWLQAGFGADMGYLTNHLELKLNLTNLLPGAKSVVVVQFGYNQDPIVVEGMKISRYAVGKDYHKVLRKKLQLLEKEILRLFPQAKTRVCVDSAPVLERAIAQQAGLGWFGKNSCLIDSKFGSWFFIGSIITNLDLKPSQPALGGCGTCRKCIEACPTGAIKMLQDRWAVDSNLCISYQTIEKKGAFSPKVSEMLSGWIFGCDVCQEVCPFNEPRENQPQRAKITEDPKLLNRLEPNKLSEFAHGQEDLWDELSLGRPIRRAGLEGFKRNITANKKHS